MKARVRAAVDRGIAACLALHESDLGALHTLAHVAEVLEHDGLRAYVRTERERFRTDAYRGLLFPELPPVPLPAAKGSGHGLLHWYLLHASTRADPERSAAAVREYLALELHGFNLTHQLLAVIWLDDIGLLDPATFEPRLSELARALEAEIAALPRFSDLFAEQVNVRLWIDAKASPDPAWLETILAAQAPSGLFEDPTRYTLVFDGASRPIVPSPAHTSAHALSALAQALTRL